MSLIAKSHKNWHSGFIAMLLCEAPCADFLEADYRVYWSRKVISVYGRFVVQVGYYLEDECSQIDIDHNDLMLVQEMFTIVNSENLGQADMCAYRLGKIINLLDDVPDWMIDTAAFVKAKIDHYYISTEINVVSDAAPKDTSKKRRM